MSKFCIVAPNIGAKSEIFIRRHMELIAPGETIIIGRGSLPPYCGHWWPKKGGKVIALDRQKALRKPLGIVKRCWGSWKQKQSGRSYATDCQLIVDLLSKNHATTVMFEYADLYLDEIQRLLKDFPEVAIFVHGHGYDISIPWLKQNRPEMLKRYPEVLNRISGLIVMSEFAKSQLIQIGMDSRIISVIPYGVELDSKQIERCNKDSLQLLAVGRMVPKKAPIHLLESVRRAVGKGANVYLDYIGEGALEAAVRDYVEVSGLVERVTFHGALPNVEVRRLMTSADVFIQHSVVDALTGDAEGLPVAILEAMAAGLPVISTFHAGIPEAVRSGREGILVNERDVSGMAEAIVDLYRDSTKRIALGKQARHRIESTFSISQEISSLRSLMELGSPS